MATLDETLPAKEESWKMFDKISRTYDFLNHTLSFGIDKYWRRKVRKYLPKGKDLQLLDLATGTGDQLFSLMKSGKIRSAVGIDLSQEMLRVGTYKLLEKPYSHQVSLLEGSATDIPLDDASVDAVTISFGIRNVANIDACLKESIRVLRPGGKMIVLEFSMPKNRVIKALHLFYLRKCLPVIGGIISRNKTAYRYLNQTIETFPSGKAFTDYMEKNGFINAKAKPLTFGIASLYSADTPNSREACNAE